MEVVVVVVMIHATVVALLLGLLHCWCTWDELEFKISKTKATSTTLYIHAHNAKHCEELEYITMGLLYKLFQLVIWRPAIDEYVCAGARCKGFQRAAPQQT